jgi:type III secretion apparatus YscR/HrcR family protein
MQNDISMIAILMAATLAPFLIAVGTCYIKFSVVFTLVRNGLGLQQVPSNMVINGLALMLAVFIMQPVIGTIYDSYTESGVPLNSIGAVKEFLDTGLGGYKAYLAKYADPSLVGFFERAQQPDALLSADIAAEDRSLFSLLPAYALTELKEAFRIGFYLYLPFVVVDLVISAILLALGMMMMSPVTISAPVKLILFVALDGWTLVSQGLIKQYLDVPA